MSNQIHVNSKFETNVFNCFFMIIISHAKFYGIKAISQELTPFTLSINSPIEKQS